MGKCFHPNAQFQPVVKPWRKKSWLRLSLTSKLPWNNQSFFYITIKKYFHLLFLENNQLDSVQVTNKALCLNRMFKIQRGGGGTSKGKGPGCSSSRLAFFQQSRYVKGRKRRENNWKTILSRFEGFNSAGVLNARCLLALAPLLNRIEQHPVMEPLSF